MIFILKLENELKVSSPFIPFREGEAQIQTFKLVKTHADSKISKLKSLIPKKNTLETTSPFGGRHRGRKFLFLHGFDQYFIENVKYQR